MNHKTAEAIVNGVSTSLKLALESSPVVLATTAWDVKEAPGDTDEAE